MARNQIGCPEYLAGAVSATMLVTDFTTYRVSVGKGGLIAERVSYREMLGNI